MKYLYPGAKAPSVARFPKTCKIAIMGAAAEMNLVNIDTFSDPLANVLSHTDG